MSEKLLTLRREPDGTLRPYVDGDRLVGAVDTTVNTNGTQQLVQLVFHAALVLFETARHPAANKLN